MQENIESPSKEISIVIYDNPLPPKYIKINKKLIKQFFVFLPIFLLLLFVAIASWGVAQKSFVFAKKQLNEQDEVKSQKVIEDLKNELSELNKENKILTTKLASGIAPGQDDIFLMNIKKPYGMQNLISSQSVSVDQFNLIQDADKVTLNFQIISTVPETKITGHVLVYMNTHYGFSLYPAQDFLSISDGIKFSSGEPFSVSRLRPTSAQFSKKLISNQVSFSIYIFNREGDLLLTKKTETFKIGKE